MEKKYLFIFILMLVISCNKQEAKNLSEPSIERENTTENKNQVEEPYTEETDVDGINIPEKPIFRDIQVDTSEVFGIWSADPEALHADFYLTADSFYIVDTPGTGELSYILEKSEITVFFNDHIEKGVIISAKNDTLKIKWRDSKITTNYVRFLE